MNSFYVAIPLPSSIKNQLNRACHGLPYIEWIETESFFLTIAKLGNVEGTDLLDIQDQLKEISFSPFSLGIEGIEIIKRQKGRGYIHARVCFSEPLDNLNKIINNSLRKFTFIQENDFKPSILLGYFEKIDPVKVGEYLENYSCFTSASFTVDSFILIQKKTTPKHLFFLEQQRYLMQSKKN